MSAHVWSFQNDAPYNRDLSDFELWERSLRRSVHRREITEAARKGAARRKGAAVAVSATMAVGPAASPFAALASAKTSRGAAPSQPVSSSSAISMPSGSLVAFGDTGDAVAAVQRQVGVDDDGIFGPITQGAVQDFQKRYGIPVTGRVDARTWQALFKSNVTYVGGSGKTVMTVYNRGGGTAAAPAASAEDGPAPSTTAPKRTVSKPKTQAPATTAPNSHLDRRGDQPRRDDDAQGGARRLRALQCRAPAGAARARSPRPSRAP